jgi:hypothetical protein
VSVCLECKAVIDWDEGGFIWEGDTFCEEHDPQNTQEEESKV